MRFLHVWVCAGLAVVLGGIVIAVSGCGSSQKVKKAEPEPGHLPNEEGFVRNSPLQDADTIVLPGVAFSPCEECTRRYSEMIHEIIRAMCEGMGEGALKGFLGLKR
jgi:hypothetical protein